MDELSGSGIRDWSAAGRGDELYRNFILFCTSFSVVHGTVDGVLAYAVPVLGSKIGGITAGILYATYSFSAIIISDTYICQRGPLIGVLTGLGCFLIYITSFLLALSFPPFKWYLFVPGSVMGGVGAGILWPSQGAYYFRNSLLYSMATKSIVSDEEGDLVSTINTRFASIFAFFYLSSETIVTALATLFYVTVDQWQAYIFTFYSTLAFFSYCIAARGLSALGFSDIPIQWNKLVRKMLINSYQLLMFWFFRTLDEHQEKLSASELEVLVDRRITMLCLIPYQLSFGFTSSFFVFYIQGIVMGDHGKEGYIGLSAGLVSLVAAAIAIPLGYLGKEKYEHFDSPLSVSGHESVLSRRSVVKGSGGHLSNKAAIILAGIVSFASVGVAVIFFSNDTLSSWPYLIVLTVIYGMGRGIWENTNKAVVAEVVSWDDVLDEDMEEEVDDSSVLNSMHYGVAHRHAGVVEQPSAAAGERRSGPAASAQTSDTIYNRLSDGTSRSTRSAIDKPLPLSPSAAFAIIYFFSGIGGSIGFVLYPLLVADCDAGNNCDLSFHRALCALVVIAVACSSLIILPRI